MAQHIRGVLTVPRTIGSVRASILACALVFAASTASTATVAAQSVSRDSISSAAAATDGQPSWTLGAWLAGGTHEPLKTRLGHKDDRALYIFTITGYHPLFRSGRFFVRYTPGIIPLLIATGNRDYSGLDGCPPRDVCALRTPHGYIYPTEYVHTAYAGGIIPISFDGTYALTDRIGFTMGASGGGVYFDRVIPDPYAERFNFLADGNIGFRLRMRTGAVTAGFRLNHISNGNRGVVNPGMDSRLLYIAFER